MKKLLLCLVLALMLAGCASQYSQSTRATLKFAEDGRPLELTLQNNKSYSDLKIDVVKRDNGTYELHYSAAKTDANGVAKIVAESNAKLVNALGGLVSTGAAIVGAP